MSRPRKPEADQLTERLVFRHTEADAARLAELSRQTRMSASDLMRHLLRRGRVEVRQPSHLPIETIKELNRTGVNLNQIARRLNATGQLVPGELSRTLARLNAILHEAQGLGSERHTR
jgi:type II secretory pathway component PulJ